MSESVIKKRTKINIQQVFFYFMLVSVIILFTILNPKFMSPANAVNIARQMAETMILAVGLTFVLISGGVDLSIAKTGVMAGCVAGSVMVKFAGVMPEWQVVMLGIVLALIAGGLIGLLNGIIISKLRVLPFIATMGSMTIAFGIAMLLTGGRTISKLPKAFTNMGTGNILRGSFENVKGVQGIPISVLIMIGIVTIGALVIKKTEFGLNIYAIGGNYKAAKLAGLNNDRILISVYVISGVLSAFAGLILTARYISAQPGLWTGTNLAVIAGCVIGGTSMQGGSGSVVKSLLGMLLMTCLSTGLNLAKIDYSWQQVITGVLVITAVSLDMLSRRKEV